MMDAPSLKALFARTAGHVEPGLEAVLDLLERLGNPHRRLAAIHVAGTNGKGSVCAMIESVLRASGFRTGLYTSPHLIDFSERFRLDGVPAGERTLDAALERTLAADAAARRDGLRPATFFEISTAAAFLLFAESEADVVVLETGMGGRWDATNVVIPLLSVITRIDLDHAEWLGDSLAAVAAEKAGIVKPGRPVVSAPQAEEAAAELLETGAPIVWADEAASVAKIGEPQRLRIETPNRRLSPIRLPLLGAFQRENAALAVAALELAGDLLDFEPAFERGLEAVRWPGRFELVGRDPPTILDGAHNPAAARALSNALKEAFPRRSVAFVLGFLTDKAVEDFAREIAPAAGTVWTVSLDDERGLDAEAAAVRLRAAGLEAEAAEPGVALERARTEAARKGGVICLTGSLRMPERFSDLLPGIAT